MKCEATHPNPKSQISRRGIVPYNYTMTIDERIEKLLESQAKTEIILAGILDSIKRLERIALAHEVRLDDVDGTLAKLEARRPQ